LFEGEDAIVLEQNVADDAAAESVDDCQHEYAGHVELEADGSEASSQGAGEDRCNLEPYRQEERLRGDRCGRRHC
jgi:hypothetical protein